MLSSLNFTLLCHISMYNVLQSWKIKMSLTLTFCFTTKYRVSVTLINHVLRQDTLITADKNISTN